MNIQKSLAVSTSDDTLQAEQVSTQSKGAVRRRRINMRMVQNVLLIWLDNNIDKNSADYQNTITQLRCVVNTINIFMDGDQCIEFLKNMKTDKACMIISCSLRQDIVPRVHYMSQVDSIFIFCDKKKRHEQLTENWPKIKGTFTKISSICKALKQAAQQCEQNAISISFMAINDDVSKKNLDQFDLSFIYAQILKEIVLGIEFEEKHITEFVDYYRNILPDNENELKTIDKLEQNYRDETPIWWYKYNCFLYSMLNRALRLMNFDIIIKMGFFIADLHRHIEKLHKEQFHDQKSENSFMVYRGQGMSRADFKQMTKHNGGFISFNNFLCTSMNRNASLLFAEKNQSNPDLVGILFIITIDPSKSSASFASISRVHKLQVEEDVLFSIHTVFRICAIKPMDGNTCLFQVELTLTSDNDKELCALTNRIREETFPSSTGWYRLGLLLHKMDQFEQAEEVYEILLEQTAEESEKALIYHQIGRIKDEQEEYKEAIIFYEKSIEIYKNSFPPNHPNLVSSYNNIGVVYYNVGENLKALSSYEKALTIQQQLLPPNHLDLASSYNSIGLVHDNMGEYSKALSSYEKALEIQQQSLPPNHLDLAMSYNNIGNVCDSMGEYLKALASHEEALKIRQESLPSNHLDLAMSYNNIGNVYGSMDKYSKALSFHEKALEIKQQSLPPNHPNLASSYNNIGAMHYNMGENAKALWYYNKTHEIFEKTLPPNHPNLSSSYDNIGLVYENMGNYTKSNSFYKRAVTIAQRSLPSNHPHIQKLKKNLNRIKQKL